MAQSVSGEGVSTPVPESDEGPPPSLSPSATAVIATAPKALPRLAHPHTRKFRLAVALLFVVAVTAVAATVVLLVNHTGRHASAAVSAVAWSSWHPANSGSEGDSEIADHVAAHYLLNASTPLDEITPISVADSSNAGVTTGSGLTVVVNTATSATATTNLELLIGKTVAYNVCGLGLSDCELAGKPSIYRMLALRREALELALYTFEYQPQVQNVVAVLPPGHTVTTSGTAGTALTVTVLFERAALKTLLQTPITKFLSSTPLQDSELQAWSKTNEATLVNDATAQWLFSSQVETQQEGGDLLVLNPLTQ